MINQLRSTPHGLPSAVQLPMWITQDGPGREWAGQHAGFLGHKYDPFVMDYGYLKLNKDFNAAPPEGAAILPGKLPSGFVLRDDIGRDRLARRLELQQILGRPRIGEGTPLVRDWTKHQAQALRRARRSVNMECLCRRRRTRLAAARSATTAWEEVAWSPRQAGRSRSDTRDRDLRRVGHALTSSGTHARSAFAATQSCIRPLLDDLADRGMLDTTLIAWMGEFGRTPMINANSPPGRDHWARVYSTLLAGGGVRGGQVHGKSDNLAAEPKDNPVHVSDFVATIYHALGDDADTRVVDPLNRPHHIVAGRPLLSLF